MTGSSVGFLTTDLLQGPGFCKKKQAPAQAFSYFLLAYSDPKPMLIRDQNTTLRMRCNQIRYVVKTLLKTA